MAKPQRASAPAIPTRTKNGKARPESGLIAFSVDSALLRELGERLIGRPYIALAELIKNSYDADAHDVEIELDDENIVVTDNGHGMSLDEFRHFWMRIGTPHKQGEAFSRDLKRPLTGSKGIGRLSVQFLARRIEIVTTSTAGTTQLTATVDWDEAISAGDLTTAVAHYKEERATQTYTAQARHGTKIRLTSLNDRWTEKDVQRLATEIWTLQPPTRSIPKDDPRRFTVALTSTKPAFASHFKGSISAGLDLWSARVRGKLLPHRKGDPPAFRTFACSVQFRNSTSFYHEFPVEDCVIDSVSYDVRIFSLHHRQRFGISVDDARAYLKVYGGVHIYDAGFNLPYYGHMDHVSHSSHSSHSSHASHVSGS